VFFIIDLSSYTKSYIFFVFVTLIFQGKKVILFYTQGQVNDFMVVILMWPEVKLRSNPDLLFDKLHNTSSHYFLLTF
jgi:hypothetical protein